MLNPIKKIRNFIFEKNWRQNLASNYHFNTKIADFLVSISRNFSSDMFKILTCDRNNKFPHFCFSTRHLFWVKYSLTDSFKRVYKIAFQKKIIKNFKHFVKNEIIKKLLFYRQNFAIYPFFCSACTIRAIDRFENPKTGKKKYLKAGC